MNSYEAALDADAKGYTCIPILPGLKIPAVKWKRFQTEMPTHELYRTWFENTRNGIALITAGLVVFDCDELAKAQLVLEECGPTTHMVRTPRGVHLGYRRRKGVVGKNLVQIKG